MFALSDTVARSLVAPAEMPAGVVTALLSGTLFFLLLRRRLTAAFGES